MLDFINEVYDERKFKNSNVDYGIVTVNFTQRKAMSILKTENNPDLLKYVLASCTCYPAFKKTEINEEEYIDGGYSDNLPINLAIELGATDIIAVDLGAIGVKRKANKDVNIKYISPKNELGSFLMFHSNDARRAMKYGYNYALKAYNKLDGDRYSFYSKDLYKNYMFYYDRFNENIRKALLRDKNKSKTFDALLGNSDVNKFFKSKKYDITSKIFNESLEYAGELLNIDDSSIYSIHIYNYMLKNKLKKIDNINDNIITEIIKNANKDELYSKELVLKFFYNELKQSSIKRKELIALVALFPKIFMAAVYLYVI